MTALFRPIAFRRGAIAALPFILVLAPFATLFGVAASEAGFDLFEIMAFSVLVVAGASQFTAVQMMSDNAPTLIVVLTALAVNLRMAMYSASLAPHLDRAGTGLRAAMAFFLFDQPYGLSIADYERNPAQDLGDKVSYFFGAVVPCVVPWWLFTWIGATVGGAIPPAFALDFAVPITFLAMIGPMLRTPAHLAAAGVSVAGALVLVVLPYNLGLLVAAALGMAAGARVETWQERRVS